MIGVETVPVAIGDRGTLSWQCHDVFALFVQWIKKIINQIQIKSIWTDD